MYFQVFALLVLASTMCSAEPVLDTPAARPSAIESIVKQLELVTGNLNVLHTVLGEMAHEYDTLQAPAVKSDQLIDSIDSALNEVDHVQKVVDAVKEQLNGLAIRSPRNRRSVQLNEANLNELNRLISLLRNVPTVDVAKLRVRRQASNIISNTAQTASNGLSEMLMLATNLSNGIRRRLTTISSQIADLTTNGVLQLNEAATNTVQGAANMFGTISNSAVGTVNTVTGQISNAITNGVKQVNTLAQNTLG